MTRSGLVLVAVVLGTVAGCSLVFSPDRRRGTSDDAGASDAALADAPAPETDGGSLDAGADAPPDACDVDGDGYLDGRADCDARRGSAPADCDDAEAAVHPGAVPICGNRRSENCDAADHAGVIELLAASEVGFLDPVEIRTAGHTVRPEVALAIDGTGFAYLGYVDEMAAEAVVLRFPVEDPEARTELRSTSFAPTLRAPVSIALRTTDAGSVGVAILAGDSSDPMVRAWVGTIAGASAPSLQPIRSSAEFLGRIAISGGAALSDGSRAEMRVFVRERVGGTISFASYALASPATSRNATTPTSSPSAEWLDVSSCAGSLVLVDDPDRNESMVYDTAMPPPGDMVVGVPHYSVRNGDGRAGLAHFYDDNYHVLSGGTPVLVALFGLDRLRTLSFGYIEIDTGATSTALPAIETMSGERFAVAAREQWTDGQSVAIRLFEPGAVEVPVSDCCGPRPVLPRATIGSRVLSDLSMATIEGPDAAILVAAVAGPRAAAPDTILVGGIRACRAE